MNRRDLFSAATVEITTLAGIAMLVACACAVNAASGAVAEDCH